MAIHVPDIGPRIVGIGDPTTALGADMTMLGLARNVAVRPAPSFKNGSTVTGQANLEANFYQGNALEVSFDVPRSVANDVRSYLPHVDANGDYVALGASMPKQTLVLIHPDDAADDTAGASAKTRWFPAVTLSGQGDEAYSATGSGTDDADFVTLTFMAGYVATDQNGDPVPEAAQPDFHGDRLSAHGMTWVLPTPYGPAS